jgi:N utilization substance protein B
LCPKVFLNVLYRKETLKMSVLKRKEAREVVVGLLFETEFKTEDNSAEIFAISSENREIPEDDYIKSAYFGVCENREKIDELIGAHSNGWKTHRLTRLSRSVMRLAVYEMLFCEDIPHSVSINEAVELTKKFDDPKAKAFVNGVLNSVKNALEAEDGSNA